MKLIKTKQKILYPIFLEQRYQRELLSLVNKIQSFILSFTFKNHSFKSSYISAIRKDDIAEEVDRFIELIKIYALNEVRLVVQRLIQKAQSVNLFNRRFFTKAFKFVPETSISIDNELKMWVSENTALIRSIPEKMLDKVADTIYDSVRNKRGVRELATILKKNFDVSRNRAKIIARDQISKLNGNITRARNLSLGITEYQWLSARDERVRHSHDVLEGKICSWNDAEIYKNAEIDKKWKSRSSIGGVNLHPGQDIMCRCTSVAIISAELAA
jgi:SPP1 gp7 family putative phage head morphogenesis protein